MQPVPTQYGFRQDVRPDAFVGRISPIVGQGGVGRRCDGLLLTCFRYKDPDQRRQVRTTNAIERRFREVRRRTRPMGAFQDRTSMDRILFAIFLHENKQQGISTLFPLTHKS